MATGEVKWFNNAKGWGFITSEDGTEAFVHYSDIEGDGFRALYVGESVDFEMTDGPRGAKAVHVQRKASVPVSQPVNTESASQ